MPTCIADQPGHRIRSLAVSATIVDALSIERSLIVDGDLRPDIHSRHYFRRTGRDFGHEGIKNHENDICLSKWYELMGGL